LEFLNEKILLVINEKEAIEKKLKDSMNIFTQNKKNMGEFMSKLMNIGEARSSQSQDGRNGSQQSLRETRSIDQFEIDRKPSFGTKTELSRTHSTNFLPTQNNLEADSKRKVLKILTPCLSIEEGVLKGTEGLGESIKNLNEEYSPKSEWKRDSIAYKEIGKKALIKGIMAMYQKNSKGSSTEIE